MPSASEQDYTVLGCHGDALLPLPLFTPNTAVPPQGAVVPVKSSIAGSVSHGQAASCTGFPNCQKGFLSGDILAYSVNVTEAKQYSFDLLVKNAGPTEKRIVVSASSESRTIVLPPNQPELAYRFPTTSMRLEKGANIVTLSFGSGFTAGNVASVAQLSIH